MSVIQPGKTGPIPDINVRCPEYSQVFLAIFRTSMCDVRNVTRIFVPVPDNIGPVPDIAGHIPDITGYIPDITGYIPDITGCIPDIIFMTKWMSGIQPGLPGRIPDIVV